MLCDVDFVAAEDTRNSAKLLTLFGIRKELVSYHEHNKASSGERLIARLSAGESCALVTDAGMPAISDPGEDLVRLCAAAGVVVSVVPGPCAAVSALALSGISTLRFCFEGFLPVPKSERRARLDVLRDERRTMILYEAPHRLVRTLDDLCALFGGERRIALCRELTKINEDVARTTLAGAVAYYAEHEPRGEYVLILEGAEEAGIPEKRETADAFAALAPEEHVARYEADGLSHMDAIKAAARDRGIPKSALYKMLLDGKK